MMWALQDAKNQFSKVVRLAGSEGPQTVTIRGETAVVVLSVRDYEALKAQKPSLVSHLLSGPAWDDDLVEAINERAKTPAREIDL